MPASIRQSKNKKLIKSSHVLKTVAPFVIGVSLLGAIFYSPLITLTRQQAPDSTVNLATSKSNSRPVTTPAITKTTAPPTTAPVASTHSATPAPSSTSAHKSVPVVVPAPGSSVSSLTPSSTSTSSSSPTTSGSPTTTTVSYTSTNWSGYMATSGVFSEISASWIAPQPTSDSASTSADATWIGIGGVTTSDLIQVGTQNLVAPNGVVSTEAFYELLPNVSQAASGITVTGGDSMTASLLEISSGEWTIKITDNTNGQSFTDTVAYISSHSSAEWIEEDPSFTRTRQIPFDNFGEVAFTNGSAFENGTTVSIASSEAQPITMVNTSGQAVATPSAINGSGTGFSVSRSGA